MKTNLFRVAYREAEDVLLEHQYAAPVLKSELASRVSSAIAKSAQQSVQRTAIAAGGLCGLAGFFIGWLVFGG